MPEMPDRGVRNHQGPVRCRKIFDDRNAVFKNMGKRPNQLIVLINPEIVETEGQVTEDEGCLSIPDFVEVLTRPERVKTRFLDRNGVPREMWGSGLLARAVCHEIDHLDGALFVDHLRGFKKERILKKIQKLVKAGMWG